MKNMLLVTGLVLGGLGSGFGAGLMRPIHTVPGELDMLTKHGHIQGAACSEKAIYLSHAGGIVKLDWKTGRVLKTCSAKSHLGDIAYHDGKIYGAHGLWSPPKGKPRTMIGVWDAETLEPKGEWFYEYSAPDGVKSRGFDGAIVLDGVLYTGIDHYGKGTWDHPPHNDCTLMMISVADMKMIGTKDVALNYPIHYGVQDLGTDGEILMLANYGAGDKGLCFTRATKDFKVMDDHRFHASEGFGLVPKSIAQRDEQIFFSVMAMGGNMQGWRKDPKGNPPQVRLDFHVYDKKTGEMRNITDYSAGSGTANTIFITDDQPIRLEADDWKKGMPEWPSVDIKPPWTCTDFRGYDRIAVDFINEEAAEGNLMSNYISGPKGHVAKGLPHIGHPIPGDGFDRWIMSLSDWKNYAGVDPANIGRVHFYFTHPQKVRLRFYRVTLLPKGVECPQPSESFIKKVIDPMLKRKYGKRGLTAPKVTTVEDIVKAQEELGEIDRVRRQKESAARFREACRAAGQAGAFCLGEATSMEKIRPRNFGEVKPTKSLGVRLAKGEYEAVQLLVMAKAGDLKDVQVTPSTMKSEKGVVLPAESVKVEIMGYLNITNRAPYPAGKNRTTADGPGYLRERVKTETGWWPDPILDFVDRADVKGDDLQSFWVRVKAPRDQAAGTYRGVLKVSARDVAGVEIPFSVRVNDFAVPVASPLPLAITFDPKPTRQWEDAAGLAAAAARERDPESPLNQWRKHKNEWCDFLGEHYLVNDSLYLNTSHGAMPNFEMLMRAEKAGRLVRFNLGYWNYPKDMESTTLEEWRKNELTQLKKSYDKAKALGIVSKAYVYGCDEASTNTFERIRWAAAEIRREMPGVPISTTAYDDEFGVGTPLEVIDWFTPQTNKFDPDKARASRAAGHQVWWYFACDNKAPYSNMFIECQAIEHRSFFGAQTVKYRPDGYLYYQVSLWNSIRPITKGPFTDWDPRSWTKYHGDGSWICCGPNGMPISTIRLENFRDGLEDYAYAMILEKKLKANPAAPWAKRAKELLSVPMTVVDSVSNFSDDPVALYAWRDEIADLIER